MKRPQFPTAVRAKDLVGRTITAVNFRRFHHQRPASPGECPYTTDPLLTLDNGRKVWFVVGETEVGEYGIEICMSEKKKRGGG